MKNLYKIENELYIISDNENINENDYIITNFVHRKILKTK